jgi:hypothetical protein
VNCHLLLNRFKINNLSQYITTFFILLALTFKMLQSGKLQ